MSPLLQSHHFRAMASTVNVQLVGVGPDEAAAAFATVEGIFREVESSCTRFDPASPLMTANVAPRRWHELPRSCYDAIRAAHEAYLATEGRFDPRVLRSLELHGYDRSLPFATGGVQVNLELPAITPDRRRWRPKFDETRRAVRLGSAPVDLGGIGKGLAVRWAMAAVQNCGSAALVEAGGDLATRGPGPEGTGWRAAVENPQVPPGAPQGRPVVVLAASDRAVATSSLRLRTWKVAGRDAHHLIDPRTARPAATGLASVTVIQDDPAWAEVWSKSLFLAGADDIDAQARARGLAAVWVDATGRVRVSPAAQEFVLWQVRHAGS